MAGCRFSLNNLLHGCLRDQSTITLERVRSLGWDGHAISSRVLPFELLAEWGLVGHRSYKQVDDSHSMQRRLKLRLHQ